MPWYTLLINNVNTKLLHLFRVKTRCIDLFSSKQGMHLINFSMQLAAAEMTWTSVPIRSMNPELI